MTLTRLFAHRGASHQARENTIEAFVEARRLGADGVELDVRRTADGALAVHHDELIEGVGPIDQLSVGELPAHVALLSQALEACADLLVNVEIKVSPGEDLDRLAAEVLAQLADARSPEAMGIFAFDLDVLDAARRLEEDVPLGWLLGPLVRPIDALEIVIEHHLDAVHPFVLGIDAELVTQAHRAGISVVAWTVNARHDLEAMCELGVDGVITDEVELALEVLGGVQEGP
jgi:glycerophosphoryl diester phosphodiesterase